MICKNRTCTHRKDDGTMECVFQKEVVLSDEGVCLLQEPCSD